MTSLSDAIKGVPGQPASVRVGRVVTARPLSVDVQGTVFDDVGVIGSYVPLAGDVVALVGQCSNAGSDPASWMVVGTLGAPTAQAGNVTISFVSLAAFTTNVTFPSAFARQPSVSTNINSGVGATANWQSRAFAVTTTGFTMFVFSTVASTWTNIDVQWQAQVQTT